LNPLAQLAAGQLAHDGQPVRVRVQRLADELADRARAVVLGGVDVAYAGLDRRPQDEQRLVTVSRRAEEAVAGELHRPVTGPAYPPPAERERPAQVVPIRPSPPSWPAPERRSQHRPRVATRQMIRPHPIPAISPGSLGALRSVGVPGGCEQAE